MAKKLDSIVELAAQKTREISANSGNYMAFLTTAAHNFKYLSLIHISEPTRH